MMWKFNGFDTFNIIEKIQNGNWSNNWYDNDSGLNYNYSYLYLPRDNLFKILYLIRIVVVTIATRSSDMKKINYKLGINDEFDI